LPFKVQPVCFISLKDKNDKYLAKTWKHLKKFNIHS
jgi:hypothetical protein